MPARSRWMPAVVALAIVATVIVGAGGGSAANGLAIVGVTVVDPETGALRADQTVVIAGDSIVAVGAAGDVRAPRGSLRVDGAGRYLVPGLWDMHVHLSMTGSGALPVLLAYGITGVRDMGGDPVVLQWRDSVGAARWDGPRIKGAGIIVESKRWLDAVIELTRPLDRPDLLRELERRFGIATPEDAERAVDSLVRLGADFLKIRNYPSPSAYYALVRAASRNGLPIAGHAPPMAFVAAVSDSGFASFEHGVLDFRDGGLVDGFSGMADDARRELFARFARNGTAYDPTFVSGAARLIPDSTLARMIEDTAGVSNPALRHVPAQLRDEWRTQLAMRTVDPSPATDWAAIHRDGLRNVRAMADAGVTILAGTDLPVPSLVPGLSLHEELETLVREAGLTPAEALRAATTNAAGAVGLPDRAGRVAVGYLADLVLLDADPLADIGATRRIVGVVAGGRWYDRGALDRLLEAAR